MIEAEWLACTDPVNMLKHLRGGASDRQLRLFACACARLAWDVLTPASRNALEVSERFDDQADSGRQLKSAFSAARNEGRRLADAAEATMDPDQGAYDPDTDAAIRANAAEATRRTVSPKLDLDAVYEVTRAVYYAFIDSWSGPEQDPDEAFCVLLREVFGNPFHKQPPLSPSVMTWQDNTVLRLAEGIYQARRFGELPILADALEEAGCEDADILTHLRSPGPHVLGCWVRFVDYQYRQCVVSDSSSRGQVEPDRQLIDRADAISAEGGSLLKHGPTRRGLTISARECKGSNGGSVEPDRRHPAQLRWKGAGRRTLRLNRRNAYPANAG